MQVTAIKVQRLYLQVAQQLRGLIDSGSIELGQRLPAERELAEKFGVSRPTIREAMIALEIAGVVEVRSGSGVYVRDQGEGLLTLAPSEDPGPFEILEARKLIEGEVCALAAGRITDQQLEQLAELLQAMEHENQSDQVTEKADEKFHCTIAEAAGNSALATTISWLWELRNESEISTRFYARVREEGVRPIIADHRAILAALQLRDPAAARQAMADHLQRVIDMLLVEG